MNALSIGVLCGELVFVAAAAVTLFRLRRHIGLGPLYIFVGTNQYLSVLLAASLYVGVAPGVFISPGSAVLFSSSLFVILMVYLGTDIPTSRGLIFGVLIANVTLTVLLWFTSLQMQAFDVVNPLNLPIELFVISPRMFVAGTAVLIIDFLLVVVLYQWMTLRFSSMPLLGRILVTLVTTLVFDALVFSILGFAGTPEYAGVLRGQLLGKIPAGVLFGLILYFYLRYFEPQVERGQRGVAGQVDDVFSIFTYRERYRQVRRRLAVAEAASLAKSRFLANMSHELRTPLNAIIGFTSVMLKNNDNLDGEHRMLLGRVWANGMHLLDLINGLLDLSKIESGRNELHLADIDLNQLVVETVEQVQGDAAGKHIRLNVSLPTSPVTLRTDRMRLKQVLINLVGNALKFTDNGGVSVRLSCQDSQPQRLDVIDSGIGIDAEKVDKIFEPFFHDDAAIRNEPGVGLGLAISRALCEQMGHRLDVASVPGQGSTFSIVFFAVADDVKVASAA